MARAAPCSSSHEVRPNFLSLDEAIDAVRGSFSTRPIGRRPTACASERAAPSGPRLDLRNRRPATCGSCRLGRACRGLDQERRRRSSGVARGSSFENPSRRPRGRPPAIASAEDLARPSAAERAKIRRAEARQDLLRPVVVQRKRIPSPSPDMHTNTGSRPRSLWSGSHAGRRSAPRRELLRRHAAPGRDGGGRALTPRPPVRLPSAPSDRHPAGPRRILYLRSPHRQPAPWPIVFLRHARPREPDSAGLRRHGLTTHLNGFIIDRTIG